MALPGAALRVDDRKVGGLTAGRRAPGSSSQTIAAEVETHNGDVRCSLTGMCLGERLK